MINLTYLITTFNWILTVNKLQTVLATIMQISNGC